MNLHLRLQTWPNFINKVIRGKVPPVTSEYGYSEDLIDLVKLMLKVNIKLRPSATQILNYPVVKEMEEIFLKDIDSNEICLIDESVINKKIYMPKNVNKLNYRLPKSKYENSNLLLNKGGKIGMIIEY